MDIIRRFEPLFGVWHAESFIGAGSFGRVYKIYREEFGERFYSALKYISIPAESSDIMQLRMDGMDDRSISTYYTELTKGITAETRLMNKLRGNTNIVSFEDSKVSQKPDGMGYDIFIRMELLTGLPLRMVSSPLSAEETVKLGVDICNALIICKQHGIIHRDIKPDNIFISETGDYKLGDFGIARQLEKTATFMSKKGTYNYMAPEVYKGEKYGATCDLYSLGIVMYRLLNKGRLPFMPPSPQVITPDDRENAIVRRMKGESIPAPCDADEELAVIVLKACAFDPKDRFASAKEMKDALTRYGQKDHGIVPTLHVSDFDRANNDADETQGVFGKSGDSQVPGETDPNATSGVFAAPVKEASKSEDNADPNATSGVFPVPASEVNKIEGDADPNATSGVFPVPANEVNKIEGDADPDADSGVFRESAKEANITEGEADPDATSGVFAAPVKEAIKSEDNADPEKTHRVFGVAAAIPGAKLSTKEVVEDTPETENESGDEHAEHKPKKKRTGLIIGIATAAVGIVFGALALAGVFGGKGGNDTVALNGTPVPTETAAADAEKSEDLDETVSRDTAEPTLQSSETSVVDDPTDKPIEKPTEEPEVSPAPSVETTPTPEPAYIPKSVKVGSSVFFGCYEQDNDLTNGLEPLEWVVLKKNNGNALLISKFAIETRPYADYSNYDCNWETCKLREWLNDEYIDSVFTETDKERIVTSKTNVPVEFDSDYCVEDRIFILSKNELKEFFKKEENRRCSATEHAIAQGAYINRSILVYEKPSCCWWLRSIYDDYDGSQLTYNNLIETVNFDGSIAQYGTQSTRIDIAVRPALWIKLDP